jgi:hypothetical protein
MFVRSQTFLWPLGTSPCQSHILSRQNYFHRLLRWTAFRTEAVSAVHLFEFNLRDLNTFCGIINLCTAQCGGLFRCVLLHVCKQICRRHRESLHRIHDSCIKALKHHGLLPLPRPRAARAVFLVSSHNSTYALQAGRGGVQGHWLPIITPIAKAGWMSTGKLYFKRHVQVHDWLFRPEYCNSSDLMDLANARVACCNISLSLWDKNKENCIVRVHMELYVLDIYQLG